jgi:hypothetical protein
MADFKAKAADYVRQAVEHEKRAATMTDPKLKAGFLDLARMSRVLATHMERQMDKRAPPATPGLNPVEPRDIVPSAPSTAAQSPTVSTSN